MDPSVFSQALMYHAHRYSRNAWAGEPEIDPTMDYEEREQIEGWEMTPYECLDLAYGGVLREKYVQAGENWLFGGGPSLRFGNVIWKCGYDHSCAHNTHVPFLVLCLS